VHQHQHHLHASSASPYSKSDNNTRGKRQGKGDGGCGEYATDMVTIMMDTMEMRRDMMEIMDNDEGLVKI
jgi:hypothetical protein